MLAAFVLAAVTRIALAIGALSNGSHHGGVTLNGTSEALLYDTVGSAPFGTVVSVLSGLCLDLPNGDTTNGNKLWVWGCNGHDSQKWQIIDNQLVYLGLTTKCADLPGGVTTNGNQLQIWDCNGSSGQKWGYDFVMKTLYLASSTSDATKCLDLRNGGRSQGTPVQVWDCDYAGSNQNQKWYAIQAGGQTSVTEYLNEAIRKGAQGTYTGGKGIVLRNPFDGFEDEKYDNWKVVPSTFWTNDLIVPSAVFPTGWGGYQKGNGDPNCPNNQWNGYYKMKVCPTDSRTGETGPWNYATTGYIIADKLEEVFPEFDKIQDATWGYGVFYPTDSNSVDQRCIWLASHNGYDCPGGWLPLGGTFVPDASGQGVHRGAGAYDQGNPAASGKGQVWGGGAGCHFDTSSTSSTSGLIDQTNAVANNLNLVRNHECECEYKFKDNWGHWVDQWVTYAHNVKSDDGWFAGGKSPFHGLDQVSCWVNNPRDMIDLSNMIYWKRYEWSNQLAPKSQWNDADPASLRIYWGWNELPLSRAKAKDTSLRQTYFIKLPAALCPGSSGGLDTILCLSYGAQQNLEGDFDLYVGNKLLLPGSGNTAHRPGSYVVFIREYISKGVNWQRWFWCENWISPTGKYQVKFYPKSQSNPTGACFLDWGPKSAAKERDARMQWV